MLCLLAILFATQLHAFNTGDFRTKWGGDWETPALWEVYNGSSWVNANAIPSPNLISDTYIRHHITCFTDLVLSGRMVISNPSGYLFLKSDLQIVPEAEMEIGGLRIANGNTLLNQGTILALNGNPSITLEAGSTFDNQNLVSSSSRRFTLDAISNSRLIMGANGSITGDGNFSSGYGAHLEIAHPQGLDGALALSGSESFNQLYYTFNGSSEQITGTSMPAVALGMVFDNPESISLSQGINVVNEVLVTSGTTLDIGLSVIGRSYYGAGTFSMEEGSTIYTAHPDGISSTGQTGAIQTSVRNYHSAGNYGFNGDEAQHVGSFVTAPEVDSEGRVVVNTIIVDNPWGVTFEDALIINGDVTVNEGTAQGDIEIGGEESLVDGINSSYYYHSFEPNGVQIRNYRPYTDTNNNQQGNILRRWNIAGQFAGNKRITFYWDAADDAGIDWKDSVPVVKKGGLILRSEEFDLESEPRWITVTISNLNDRASFTILKEGDDTLPVQLSTFAAMVVSGNKVRLRWVSQTESNLIGYNLLRGESPDIGKALVISPVMAAVNSSQPTFYSYDDTELQNSGTYYYWLESSDMDGGAQYFGPVIVMVELNSPGSSPQIPKRTGISKLYPNPFNPDLSVSYELAVKSPVQINIYNQRGQLVRNLYSGTKEAGSYSLLWDGRGNDGKECASGTYLIVMEHSSGRNIEKAVMLK